MISDDDLDVASNLPVKVSSAFSFASGKKVPFIYVVITSIFQQAIIDSDNIQIFETCSLEPLSNLQDQLKGKNQRNSLEMSCGRLESKHLCINLISALKITVHTVYGAVI